MGRHGKKMIFELIGFRKLLVCLLKLSIDLLKLIHTCLDLLLREQRILPGRFALSSKNSHNSLSEEEQEQWYRFAPVNNKRCNGREKKEIKGQKRQAK